MINKVKNLYDYIPVTCNQTSQLNHHADIINHHEEIDLHGRRDDDSGRPDLAQ